MQTVLGQVVEVMTVQRDKVKKVGLGRLRREPRIRRRCFLGNADSGRHLARRQVIVRWPTTCRQ